ncbi:hypothetical protein [Parendozoicomonas sp. Alg238-R29]|uniref:hypothetical protein n=1 Tax=Parendozoicomonas sp. Alg238-R29 TaxID=2993446 RepID=UPI00248EBD8B|nr:hypothetical protein [Parendozoicomonas sp. Alg238-R29]
MKIILPALVNLLCCYVCSAIALPRVDVIFPGGLWHHYSEVNDNKEQQHTVTINVDGEHNLDSQSLFRYQTFSGVVGKRESDVIGEVVAGGRIELGVNAEDLALGINYGDTQQIIVLSPRDLINKDSSYLPLNDQYQRKIEASSKSVTTTDGHAPLPDDAIYETVDSEDVFFSFRLDSERKEGDQHEFAFGAGLVDFDDPVRVAGESIIEKFGGIEDSWIVQTAINTIKKFDIANELGCHDNEASIAVQITIDRGEGARFQFLKVNYKADHTGTNSLALGTVNFIVQNNDVKKNSAIILASSGTQLLTLNRLNTSTQLIEMTLDPSLPLKPDVRRPFYIPKWHDEERYLPELVQVSLKEKLERHSPWLPPSHTPPPVVPVKSHEVTLMMQQLSMGSDDNAVRPPRPKPRKRTITSTGQQHQSSTTDGSLQAKAPGDGKLDSSTPSELNEAESSDLYMKPGAVLTSSSQPASLPTPTTGSDGEYYIEAPGAPHSFPLASFAGGRISEQGNKPGTANRRSTAVSNASSASVGSFSDPTFPDVRNSPFDTEEGMRFYNQGHLRNVEMGLEHLIYDSDDTIFTPLLNIKVIKPASHIVYKIMSRPKEVAVVQQQQVKTKQKKHRKGEQEQYQFNDTTTQGGWYGGLLQLTKSPAPSACELNNCIKGIRQDYPLHRLVKGGTLPHTCEFCKAPERVSSIMTSLEYLSDKPEFWHLYYWGGTQK